MKINLLILLFYKHCGMELNNSDLNSVVPVKWTLTNNSDLNSVVPVKWTLTFTSTLKETESKLKDISNRKEQINKKNKQRSNEIMNDLEVIDRKLENIADSKKKSNILDNQYTEIEKACWQYQKTRSQAVLDEIQQEQQEVDLQYQKYNTIQNSIKILENSHKEGNEENRIISISTRLHPACQIIVALEQPLNKENPQEYTITIIEILNEVDSKPKDELNRSFEFTLEQLQVRLQEIVCAINTMKQQYMHVKENLQITIKKLDNIKVTQQSNINTAWTKYEKVCWQHNKIRLEEERSKILEQCKQKKIELLQCQFIENCIQKFNKYCNKKNGIGAISKSTVEPAQQCIGKIVDDGVKITVETTPILNQYKITITKQKIGEKYESAVLDCKQHFTKH